MEMQSVLNLPAVPAGLSVEVRVHDKNSPGTGALATIYQVDGVTTIAQPGFVSDASGRIEFKAADGLYDIKLGGGAVSPDTTWNGGLALWVYGAALSDAVGNLKADGSVSATSALEMLGCDSFVDLSAKLKSDAITTYPKGYTIGYISTTGIANGWPSNYIEVITFRLRSPARGWQYILSANGSMIVRSYKNSTWQADRVLSESDHDHAGVYEPVFTKNTAFNKNFGTTAGTVAEGDHTHAGSGASLLLDGTTAMALDAAVKGRNKFDTANVELIKTTAADTRVHLGDETECDGYTFHMTAAARMYTSRAGEGLMYIPRMESLVNTSVVIASGVTSAVNLRASGAQAHGHFVISGYSADGLVIIGGDSKTSMSGANCYIQYNTDGSVDLMVRNNSTISMTVYVNVYEMNML